MWCGVCEQADLVRVQRIMRLTVEGKRLRLEVSALHCPVCEADFHDMDSPDPFKRAYGIARQLRERDGD